MDKKVTTSGRVGLVLDQSHSEMDEFLYQNGGSVVAPDGAVDIDKPQDVAALSFLQGMLKQGILKFPSTLSSSWSGEAFGENKAAMDIVGTWMVGSLQTDYPSI